MNDSRHVWMQYQLSLSARVATAIVVLAFGLAVAAGVDTWQELVVWGGVLTAVAALIHPMALVAVLSSMLMVQEVLTGDLSVGGVLLTAGGFLSMHWRDARGLVRLWTIPLLWVGLFLIDPLLLALLAVVPSALIAIRRRRLMQLRASAIEVGTPPPEWIPTIEAMRVAGFRYVGTIRFEYTDQESGAAVVFRLGDTLGWVVGADGWIVGHAFDGRHLFSMSKRWGLTLPHEFGQHVRSDDLHTVVLAHRRMIAFLASESIRPTPMSDEEALAFLIEQWTLDGDARARSGWGLTLRSIVDDELNLRQREAPRCLMDDPDGRALLKQWISG